MNTYPFAGEIKMFKVIKDGQEVIEWEQVDMSKREWVGLTDEEINSIRHKRDWTAPWTDTTFARAIEAKLKEKNQ